MILTILVPVRDEAQNIELFVENIHRHVPCAYSLKLIYDEDTDQTLCKRENIAQINPNAQFQKNKYGCGVVNAIRTGLEDTKSALVLIMMADLSDTPETIPQMLIRESQGFDVVVASRYCRRGKNLGGLGLKLWLSRFANQSLHFLTRLPVHDFTNGFVLYRRSVFREIQIETRGGFEFTTELILKSVSLGYRITEVPTINYPRRAGKSHFRLWAWLPRYAYWYLRILFRFPRSLINDVA
ncbi:MAG: glycosyltransferase family 2 protein [Bdellovibrionales bacterium]|nr:glycosyltransferase family 2 protein [Bdellovibrionales bacterium]